MAGSNQTTKRLQPMREPWLWFALALALTAFGFWPSFLSRPGAAPSHILIHGLSATLWMLLPVVQAVLIRRRQRVWHRQLGYASLVLAAVVVTTGLRVIQTMVTSEGAGVTLTTTKFVLLDLTGIALFVVAVALAISAARRRDIGLHLRLMAVSAIIPLEAANERTAILLLPGLVPDFSAALYASLISVELICAAIIAADWWRSGVAADLRRGRLRWPMPALLAYYGVMHIVATPVALNPGFQSFSQWFAHIGS